MRHTVSCRALAIGFIVSLLSMSQRSQAQAEAQDEISEEALTLGYDELIQRGVAEYQRGHWIEARAFFIEAHAVQPNARTQRGLGMTCFQLGKYVEAIEHFEQSLGSPLRPLGDELRAEVTRLLRDAERMVGRLRVDLSPSDASLRVDGQLVQPNPQGVVLLDAGSHEILAHAPGHESISRTVVARPGTEIRQKLELRSVEAARVAEVRAPEASQAPESALAADSEASPGAPWIVVGVSSAAVVTGAVLLGVALSEKSAIENARAGAKSWNEIEGAYARVPTFSALGIALLSAGGVGVASGLAWRFWPESNSDAALSFSPSGVRAAGSF